MSERKPPARSRILIGLFYAQNIGNNHAHYPKPIPTSPHHRSRRTQTGHLTTIPTGLNPSIADDHHGTGRQSFIHRKRNRFSHSDEPIGCLCKTAKYRKFIGLNCVLRSNGVLIAECHQ